MPARKEPAIAAGGDTSSSNEHFYYTRADGETYLVPECQQINDYVFEPATFASIAYPRTWPADRPWRPQTMQELCCEPGYEVWRCIGEKPYASVCCIRQSCVHSFDKWKQATRSWSEDFELRETTDRGIGVFTRRAFNRLDILGWYAGELKVGNEGSGPKGGYSLSLPIGSVALTGDWTIEDSGFAEQTSKPWNPYTELMAWQANDRVEEEISIDARRKGNWTRFINHSCDAHTEFALYRVGTTRIMGIKAVKSIPAGVELTISYGPTYYRPGSRNKCRCGTENCVSNKREDTVVHEKTQPTKRSYAQVLIEGSMEKMQISD